MVFVNNSVPRERMGYANGIGQTFAAGVRAFGPTLAGVLWSTLANTSFSGHQYIIYLVACVMLVTQYGLTYWYPLSIQKPFVKVPAEDDEELSLGGTIEMTSLAAAKLAAVASGAPGTGGDPPTPPSP